MDRHDEARRIAANIAKLPDLRRAENANKVLERMGTTESTTLTVRREETGKIRFNLLSECHQQSHRLGGGAKDCRG